mmetsp:Transcript_39328/g.125032  ORF Transcript_39328/g.125032 Transcript_39328/m.125032 type:complete len:259 (-) Transcript_39328:750-1526(-)
MWHRDASPCIAPARPRVHAQSRCKCQRPPQMSDAWPTLLRLDASCWSKCCRSALRPSSAVRRLRSSCVRRALRRAAAVLPGAEALLDAARLTADGVLATCVAAKLTAAGDASPTAGEPAGSAAPRAAAPMRSSPPASATAAAPGLPRPAADVATASAGAARASVRAGTGRDEEDAGFGLPSGDGGPRLASPGRRRLDIELERLATLDGDVLRIGDSNETLSSVLAAAAGCAEAAMLLRLDDGSAAAEFAPHVERGVAR